MKKILLLSDSFNGYGAENIMKWLGNNLGEHGFKVVFCSIFDREKSKDLTDRAEYYQMCFPKDVYDKNYFINGVKFLRKITKAEQYDFVITFHTNPYLMAFFAKPFGKYKTLHSERDNPFNRDTFASHIKMWLYRFADKIVFQTEGAQQFFDKRTIQKSVIIPNPITVPTFQWRGRGKESIVSVGRLFIRYKRQDVLFEAFKDVLGSNPNYRLVLYGDGPDRGLLEKMASDMGISSNVDFKGKISNVSEHLADEGIFVLTSDSEGMPNALMEAMALGMPVISTDCEPGGARALIDNGVNGIIVERSSVERLTEALKTLINDMQLQEEYGLNAREKMKQFSPERIIIMWEIVLMN